MTEGTGEEKDYDPESPTGLYKRWKVEMDASAEARKTFLEEGRDAIARFKDKRKNKAEGQGTDRRWNLFYSNVATQRAMLYGRIPEVTVSREHSDANDDVARVAALMLERILNANLDAGDPFTAALGHSLDDRLKPGLGICRVRHEVENVGDAPEGSEAHEAGEAPQGAPEPTGTNGTEPPPYECAEVEWVAWDRFAWSAGAGVWHEVQWVGFKHRVSRAQLRKNFPEDADKVPLAARKAKAKSDGKKEQADSPWDRAEVWEIWDKSTSRVYWWVDGYEKILKAEDDPLSLDGFFPCPEPMAANTCTDEYMPTCDWHLAQDLYAQIDNLQTRKGLLVDAIRVAGVYDSKSKEVKRLVDSTGQNDLYPVENWGAFSERGGVQGAVQWLPLDQITKALVDLTQEQDRLKAQLDEVTGMPDILRGQSEGAGITATEQDIKSGFASARLRATQEDFARFASDIAGLRAQIISKRFAPANIIAQSNMVDHPDQALVNQALNLLRDPSSRYRVKIEPEALAMADFGKMRAERNEIMTVISGFVSAVTPLVQVMPGSMPFLLEVLQAQLAGVKGAGDVEGIIDRAIQAFRQSQEQAAQQPQQAPPPDPKVVAQQMKGAQEERKIGLELQADLIRNQADVAANRQHEADQAEFGIKEAQVRNQMSLANKTTQHPGGEPR
jgi:hypothetical protein